MNRLSFVRWLFLALAMFLIACSPTEPELPQGFDAEDFADQGDFKIKINGEVPFFDSIGDQTSSLAMFHGYNIELIKDDVVNFHMEGLQFGYFALFGPQRNTGKWGKAKSHGLIGWNSEVKMYTLNQEFIVPENGIYLAVIGSPWEAEYKYSLGLSCVSGECAKQRYCLHYETADPEGGLGRIYFAINVDSYEDGQNLLAETDDFINESIEKGYCQYLGAVCPRIQDPVCAMSPDAGKKSYSHLCLFKADIHKQAGDSGKAQGYWEFGACPEEFLE